jgi:hypothetical protein
MADPIILSSYDAGRHAADLNATVSRLDRELNWKDLSCVIVTPAGGSIPTRCAFSWLGMIKPPNNKTSHLGAIGAEVGEAYSRMVDALLAHPDLSTWKYLLTIEHDQSVPPDGLVNLLLQMEAHPEYAAIGGLYFTKGPGGVAQIWGDPREMPLNFRPQKPDPAGGLVECSGTGMGFTMFRLAMFKDERLRRPWFKTPASSSEGAMTQDLYFWADARRYGYRCAIDCSVRVGHYDAATDTMW